MKVHIHIRTTDFSASGFGGNGGKPPAVPPRKGQGPWGDGDGDDDGEGRDRVNRMARLLNYHSAYESLYNGQHRDYPHAGLKHLADKHGAAFRAMADNIYDHHPSASDEDAAHVKSREANQASYLHHLAHNGEHHAMAARNFGRALTANKNDVTEHLKHAYDHVRNSRHPPWFLGAPWA